jgi:predicted dehydrogenase
VTGQLRVAIVGAGLAAYSHALDIVTDDTLELAGIVGTSSPSAATMAGTFGGVAYPCLDAMLDDPTVDGVIIAVPPRAVFGVLEQVTGSGKPCIVEKPVATAESGLHLLEQLAQRKAAVIAPFNRRYASHVRQARAVLAAGGIGDLVRAEAVWQGPYQDRFSTSGGTYRASARAREGVLLDSGAHALDAISLLLGGIAGARADQAALSCNPRGAEVDGEVTFNVGPISVILRLIAVPETPVCGGWSIHVRGTDGELVLDRQGYTVGDPQGGLRMVAPAAETARPVSDLHRLSYGSEALGTGIDEVVALSDLMTAIYDAASAGPASWQRPRGKALGRLNGAC